MWWKWQSGKEDGWERDRVIMGLVMVDNEAKMSNTLVYDDCC